MSKQTNKQENKHTQLQHNVDFLLFFFFPFFCFVLLNHYISRMCFVIAACNYPTVSESYCTATLSFSLHMVGTVSFLNAGHGLKSIKIIWGS